MTLETENYGNESFEGGLDEEQQLDRESVLKETKDELGEVMNGVNFSVNKEAYESITDGEKEMRKIATLISFMQKAIELGNLSQKDVMYRLAKINSQSKKALNLKENPIKIG